MEHTGLNSSLRSRERLRPVSSYRRTITSRWQDYRYIITKAPIPEVLMSLFFINEINSFIYDMNPFQFVFPEQTQINPRYPTYMERS